MKLNDVLLERVDRLSKRMVRTEMLHDEFGQGESVGIAQGLLALSGVLSHLHPDHPFFDLEVDADTLAAIAADRSTKLAELLYD